MFCQEVQQNVGADINTRCEMSPIAKTLAYFRRMEVVFQIDCEDIDHRLLVYAGKPAVDLASVFSQASLVSDRRIHLRRMTAVRNVIAVPDKTR